MIDISEPGLRRYLERLDTLAENPPAQRHRVEILKFIEGFYESAAGAKMNHALQDRLASKAMLRLYVALLEAEDAELREFYFKSLAAFEVRSLPFFLAYLERVLESKTPAADILGEYPPKIRALVANDILSCPLDNAPELLEAAKGLLPWFKEMQPREAMRFMLALSRWERTAAFPVQEALKSGVFWEAAIQRIEDLGGIQTAPDEPSTADYIECLTLFRENDLPRLLTAFLERHDSDPPASLFKAFSHLAGSEDVAVFKAVSKLLLHAEKQVQSEALRTLARIAPRDVGRIFAAAYKKNKSLKPLVVGLLPLLPGPEFKTFVESLPDRNEPEVIFATFAAAVSLDPSKAEACIRSAAEESGDENEANAVLEKLVPEAEPVPTYEASRKTSGKKEPCRLDWDKKSGADPEAGQRNFLSEANFRQKLLKGAGLENSSIRHGDFTQAALEDITFRNVHFFRTKFDRALFERVQFEDCSFEHCSFEEAEFYDSVMLCGNLSFCSLAGALFIGSRLVRYHAAESIFTGAAFNNATLLACRFRHCNLGRVKICGSNVGGAEFAHCVLDNVILEEDVFESCSFNCSHFLQAHVSGLRTMSSELLKLCRESYLREASDAGGLELRPPDGRGFELARKALERWQLACDVTFRKMRFMENNRRRMDWSREKFGAEKSKFMKLAPYLLHTEVFEHVNDVPLLPLSSCMANYQPDLTTLEFAREHFGRVELPEHQHDPVNIHGLYTIGSVGSIAQTQSSDMDFWVCYDAEDMPESMAHGLSYKLESIEQWAMEEFGLEVHFFLMDLNLIRNNNFGFSDTESSGSAQALLLKEEFYRTAMHLAGELPIWCVTEPGEKRASSRKLLDSLRKSGLIPDLVDLGGLRSIPREEFFGASLWQIVKALKSPFKSIMKFGLVEKYISAGDGEETPLLCNQLKHNLIEHRQSLMDVDPYMLLFKEVVEHYQQAGDKESMQMVRLSFALKTGLRGQINKREPLMLPEYKEIKDIFSKSDRDSPMHLSSFYISQDWPFDKLVSMGHMVNKFVIRTYSRVREEQSGLEKVAITPEDLTKLGRKIFSTFSKRKNKIEHIPFVSFSEVPFKVLHFSATGGNIGEPEHWEIQGAQEVSTSQRLHLANLRDGDSLPELLAWLTANEIFAPGMHVRGDYSISPVTTRDLSSALLSLRNFFPASKTFNTDIAETLNPERIVRAFFMLNLVKPRESPKIMDVAVIYSTNWGELFCITIQGAGEGLRKDPVEFLRKHTRQDVSEPPVMECFVPTRSKCPPLKLPARV